MSNISEKNIRRWATDGPENPTHFWCGVCDEVYPVSKFSHVASLIGVLCCKLCNAEMIKPKAKRRKAV